MPANWSCFSLPPLSVDSRPVWDEKWRLFQGKWSTLSTVMRKREPKTRKARRRASWPCWASLGPFSTCWSSFLSTSTPPCDSYPPAGWSQLIRTPWKPHWYSPAWLVVGWSQAPAIAERRPPGWDHQNLPGSSLLHRRTHPGYRYACDSNTCTVTDTWEAAADTRRPARSLFSDGIIYLQTAYLPHGSPISLSQRYFVSVHICIGFKGTYSSNGCFYTVFLSVFRETDRMCYSLIKSILGDICANNINLLYSILHL